MIKMSEHPFKNVLLVYKKSAYSAYFLERKIKLSVSKKGNLKKELRRFKRAHDEHYASLEKAQAILKKYGFNYNKRPRGQKIHSDRYDLIITMGGDGSFLETAQSVKNRAIIGINSSPSFSVGKLCVGTINDFERIIRRIANGKYKLSSWQRLRLEIEGHVRPLDCVNDLLIAHSEPPAMSRYLIKVGKVKEEQRNSGLWIATSAGSTGAIHSAGGKAFKPEQKKIQYMPRELHYGFSRHYQLKGGVLSSPKQITITSLMRDGKVFIDGTHQKINFPFNTTLKLSFSPDPLRTLKFK